MPNLTQLRYRLYIARLLYIGIFGWLIGAFFVFNTNAALPGLLFLLIGVVLFYWEQQRDSLEPHYADTLSSVLWRYLLFPWFLIM